MLSGCISAAGPSMLTVTAWTGPVSLFNSKFNPKYATKVRDRKDRDRKMIRIDLSISFSKVWGFFSSLREMNRKKLRNDLLILFHKVSGFFSSVSLTILFA